MPVTSVMKHDSFLSYESDMLKRFDMAKCFERFDNVSPSITMSVLVEKLTNDAYLLSCYLTD